MRARAAGVMAVVLLLALVSAACSSSGGSVSVGSVGATATAASAPTSSSPSATVLAGNDNSHGGGGGSGKNGGSGGGSPAPGAVDVIKVTKCWSNGPELLIKAESSDLSAQLVAYRPDGSRIGQIQNGGGNRYGGTAFGGQPSDPGEVTIRSSSGGSITVKTEPFQPEP